MEDNDFGCAKIVPHLDVVKLKKFIPVAFLFLMLIACITWFLTIPRVFDGEGWKKKAASICVNESMIPPLETFKKHIGRYPTMNEGLDALLVAPERIEENWKGPYVLEFPTDPWGKRYVYVFPNDRSRKEYDLFSFGTDGIRSKDDIGNWK
jgi:general secretion pathway protein G